MNSSNNRRGRKRKVFSAYSNNYVFGEDEEDDIDELAPTPAKRTRRATALGGDELLQKCDKLLTSLMTHKFGWPFNQPVDPIELNLPDYFEKITQPMDFGTIKKKLHAQQYSKLDEFASDVRLVFSNCWSYNLPGSDIHLMATTLSEIFEKSIKTVHSSKLQTSEDAEISEMQNVIAELRSEHQKLLNELTKLVRSSEKSSNTQAAPTPKQPKQPAKATAKGTKKAPKKVKKAAPKPKVRQTKKVVEEFGFKQKEKLSKKINHLTPDNLQKMVEFLSASSELLEQAKQTGELEIDLEKLSTATLKKMDEFVDNCLKAQNVSVSEITDAKSDDSSSSDSDSSSSSDSSDSESDGEKKTDGKSSEAST